MPQNLIKSYCRFLSVTLCLVILVSDCKENAPEKKTPSIEEAVSKGKPPAFLIRLALTDRAKKKLRKQKETVIISFEFGNEIGPDADYLSDELEVSNSQEVNTDDLKIEAEKFSAFKSNYEVLVNVYSGRKSSEYNLLSCGILQDKIEPIRGKTHTIECDLIE